MAVEWMFFGMGLLFLALGLPLAMRRVPPNAVYGLRTRRARDDSRAWYEVNRATGIDLAMVGVAFAIAAVVLPVALAGLPEATVSLAHAGLITVALSGTLVHELVLARR